MFTLIFFIAVTVLSLLHWFLYSRMVGALNITSPLSLWTLRASAVFLAVSYFLARVREDRAPESVVYVLHWISSVWLGLMFELFWISLVFLIVKLILVVTGLWSSYSPQLQTMIGRYSFFAVVGIAVVMCGYGMYRAAAPARIVNLQIPVKNITPELREMTIVMASDWHIGVLVGEKQLTRMVNQINSLDPDLILLPGDIVDRRGTRILHLAKVLQKLNATYGVFGSTGNHEYYAGIGSSLEFLKASGIYMLMNQRLILPTGLIIAGTEDQTARQFGKPLPSVASVIGEDALTRPTILLHHQPRPMEDAVAAGVDLMLAGHTHGGQIWPFHYLTRMAFPRNHGLFKTGKDHYLYTSCGIGCWGPPMRIGAPPEIVRIKLIGANETAVEG